jgi:hypothetical protein
MKAKLQLATAICIFVAAYAANAQTAAPLPGASPTPGVATSQAVAPVSGLTAGADAAIQVNSTLPSVSPSVQQLLDFKSSDIKFDLTRLMDLLRDRRHEGWVLAAYPDPKTAQPLIGAGFSLDLPARVHVQNDPLNPHPFLEASSADLWQAAGLDPERLDKILAEYHNRLDSWSKSGFRRQIRTLEPQISDEEATALLRVGAIQAVFNAKAYCRNFDQLGASQQIAMSQLVYQMGYNLQEFGTFLSLINRDTLDAAQLPGSYWRNVQLSLVQSQWARLYRVRAAAVIAMLDPRYGDNPTGAERTIGGILRPAVVRGRRGHAHATLRSATYHRTRRATSRKRTRRD